MPKPDPFSHNTRDFSQPIKRRSVSFQNDRIIRRDIFTNKIGTYLLIPSQPERDIRFKKIFTSIRPDWSLILHDRLTVCGLSMRKLEEEPPDIDPITNYETNSLLKG